MNNYTQSADSAPKGQKHLFSLGLLPLLGEYTNYLVHRALPYAKCFWALAFPSAADLFDVQPACHIHIEK